MYETEEFNKNGFHFYRMKGGTSYVDVCPERGGMVTAFNADGEDVLFMNEATLFDTSKNVRGGIPVLFPIAGQLTNHTYKWKGTSYQMANHGLARTRPWTVASRHTDENHAELTLSFQSNEETRESYPFDFEVLLTYALAGGKLSIKQRIKNLSPDPMPVYPGYHPYFAIKDKTISLKTEATQYLDYNDGQIKPFSGTIDLNGLKESVVLKNGSIEADFNSAKKLVIDADQAFRYSVLWVEGDQPFVCIEPWTARTNALNDDPSSLQLVKPDKPLELRVSIALANR
ncbi:aldose epimerase [Sporolactobacillus sp. THM7-4]|nr:aldose epimerase [Sporolactobacillus sp. THM7-4]